jgi:hypothetical protein
VGKAFYQAYLDRIATAHEYDRDSVCRLSCGEGLWWTNREDYVYTVFHKLLSKLRKALLLSLPVPRHNEKVLAFEIAQLAEPLAECREKIGATGGQTGFKVPDLGDPHGLLRARCKRPRRSRAAERR